MQTDCLLILADSEPSVVAERRLPILATMEETEDVYDELTGRLVDLVGDEGPLPIGGRPHPWTYVVSTSAGEREEEDPVDVLKDRRDEATSDVCGRVRRDPVVDLVELQFGFGSEVDPARHERAAHLASKRARTSSTGIARDGSALSASYAAAASMRSHASAA